jgi:hypothetical protein
MAEIVNLRQARKARDRRERERAADVNRLLHGRTRAERAAGEAERTRAGKTLDGARRED